MAAETHNSGSDNLGSPSSEKRKSIEGSQEQPALEDGPATKKQKLPVRGKGAPYSSHKSVSLEIPIPRLPKSERVVEEIGDSQDEDDEEEDDGENGVSADEEVFKTPMERKQHIVFDDDDHDEFLTPLERPAKHGLDSSAATLAHPATEENPGNETEEEDDDDDAPPEAVSSRHVAVKSMELAQDAAKAAEEQVAAKKRKRQERDALFKSQAEARKRTSGPVSQGDGSGATEAALEAAAQRKRKLEIPHVLPLELLESDDEEELAPVELAEGRRPKKIRFDAMERLSREDRTPRDQRVGSTVYRVLTDKADGILAPKSHKQTSNQKQRMLLRRRAPRRAGGFFVKR